MTTDVARARTGGRRTGYRGLWRRLELRVVLLLLAVLLVAPAWACPAWAAEAQPVTMTGTPTTYAGPSYAGNRSGNASEEDSQSKLWWNDGSWWSLMVSTDAGRVHVTELMPDHTWRDTGVAVDDRPDSTGDALWDGSRLYVASRHAASPLRVVRLSYDPAQRQYSVDDGFPVVLNAVGSPSATIAKDTTGRLWATWTQSERVWLAHSLGDDREWSAPFVPPVPGTTVTSGDTSAVVAFGGRVGVMWSSISTGGFHFAVHVDGTPSGSWTLETPLSGPSLSDDHINLRAIGSDPSGRLHVAVKTGFDQVVAPAAEPLVLVLTRSPDGSWTHAVAATVADRWTAPVLVLDETNARLHVLASSGTRIFYKTAPLSDIAFPAGKGQVFLEQDGEYLNNPSTGKGPVTAASGMVVLASSSTDERYHHSELAVPRSADVQAPSPPTGLELSSRGPSEVRLSWSPATDDAAVAGYRVHRDGRRIAQVAGTGYTDGEVRGSSSYRYQVEAYDAAGNVSAPSAPASVTTAETSTLVCRVLATGPTTPDLDAGAPVAGADARAVRARHRDGTRRT